MFHTATAAMEATAATVAKASSSGRLGPTIGGILASTLAVILITVIVIAITVYWLKR